MDVMSHLTERCTSLLIFEISDVEYCLSDTISYSITRPDNLYRMGNDAESKNSLLVTGSISIPIINLKKILTNVVQQTDGNSRVIIIDYNNIQFGLLVERIKEIIAVDSKFMATALQFKPDLRERYTQGILEFEDRKLLLLDIEKIVTEIAF